MRTAIVSIVIITGLVGTARADDADNQLSLSVMGLAGFLRVNAGSNVLAYERRLSEHHAVRAGADFIHVHHAADHVQSHQWTYGGSAGYRYHLTARGGLFVGAEVGYRRGHGHFGARDAADHAMLSHRQLRVLPEVGVRVPHRRLPLVFITRVAAGYGPYTVTADRDDAAGAAAVQYSEDVLAATPLVVDVEVSLGYAF